MTGCGAGHAVGARMRALLGLREGCGVAQAEGAGVGVGGIRMLSKGHLALARVRGRSRGRSVAGGRRRYAWKTQTRGK